jgi:hypothetical protein
MSPIEVHLALVGAAGTGKTEILRRLQGEDFRAAYVPTDRDTVVFDLGEYRFVVTEYSGQRFYTAADFQDVTAYILVTTDKRTDLRYGRSLQRLMPDNLPFSRMENKSDLSVRALPDSCSAKRKENLEEAFLSIGRQIYS